jgi:hypothetical protein
MAPRMPASRARAAWIASLAACLLLAAPAPARAESFQMDLELGGGFVFPVFPDAARRNYAVAGPEFFLRFGGIGERFLLHGTVGFGFLSNDKETISATMRSLGQLPEGARRVNYEAAWFASGVVSAGVFVIGGGKPGGVYLSAGLGGGATWEPGMRFVDKSGNVLPDTPFTPPAAPFGTMQPRFVLAAALGATTGKRKEPAYLSAATELGTTWWLCNGAPVGMITLTIQFGAMMPE